MSTGLTLDNIVEQRIKLAQINPNPLFEKWLLEWIEYAEQKQSMKKHALSKALTSLRKYPLLLLSGRDCAILDGFGTGICRMLDDRLKKEEHLITEQKHDQSVREAINKARDRINEVHKKLTTSGIVSSLQNEIHIENNVESSYDIEMRNEERSSVQDSNTVFMCAGSFTIVLLVDTQETVGKSKRNLDATVQLLTEKEVNFEIRRLSVGDFLWICRDNNNREVVLPYIVERKRMDDLAGSIKDGRFHEQKFRLTDCGVQNVIYLVENKGNNQFLGLPLSNLLQAATNTHVHNNFSLKFTDSHADSMFYLAVLTNVLNETYKDKNLMISSKARLWHSNVDEDTIPVLQFDEFAQASTKMRNFTIRDLFVRQLVQLKTLSVEKALAITKIFPTPRDLLLRYECVDQKEGELLLAEIKCSTGKKIGPVISRVIYNFYNLRDPS